MADVITRVCMNYFDCNSESDLEDKLFNGFHNSGGYLKVQIETLRKWYGKRYFRVWLLYY